MTEFQSLLSQHTPDSQAELLRLKFQQDTVDSIMSGKPQKPASERKLHKLLESWKAKKSK